MTNREILQTAMRQSAADLGCLPEDFTRGENVVVRSVENAGARRYLKLPFSVDLTFYGANIVASVGEKFESIVRGYIGHFPAMRCFETPQLHVLESALEPLGEKICFMAEYFLPDVNLLSPLPCPFETRLLEHDDFAELYTPEWSNALSSARPLLDVLGVGAYDGGRLVGLAACSADCDTMWQIGVDVLPEYRRQNVASALTSALAAEIIGRGIVPFYCAAWSNIASVRNAVKSGFRPAWVELTAKPAEFADKMNG